VNLEFSGELIHWRGPAPFHFVGVPEAESAAIKDVAALVTYGWGVIPVAARIRGTGWTTSLFPRDGRYLVPVKDAVRRAERLELGDVVPVSLTLDVGRGPQR
jgi:hypothetical protein